MKKKIDVDRSNRKIRVMHLLRLGGYSGAENVAISIIKGEKSYCDSIYVSPDGEINEILKINNIRHYKISRISVPAIRKAINIYKPDIIHAHEYMMGVLAALSMTKIPIVSHLHNNQPCMKKIGCKSIAYLLSSFRYKQILAVSKSIMDGYIFSDFIKEKLRIIGNPINISGIIQKSLDNSVERETYEIAYLGRLSGPKNPLRFLRIVKYVNSRINNIRAKMIGDGELRDKVEQEIHRLGLEKTVFLEGFKNNPYPVIADAKILCMTSDWEGFGLAAVEAMALGKPVITTPVGGLVDIVNDECGKLCRTGREYVNEIAKLLSDKEYYEKKSVGAARRAEELDNRVSYYMEIKKIYENIMGKV